MLKLTVEVGRRPSTGGSTGRLALQRLYRLCRPGSGNPSTCGEFPVRTLADTRWRQVDSVATERHPRALSAATAPLRACPISSGASHDVMVLERPEISLHTNGSENDVRCQSPSARSAAAQEAIRAAIAATPSSASLKTCAKLGFTFWDYLGARLAVPDHPDVPALPQLIKQRCATACSPDFCPYYLILGLIRSST